MTEITIPIWSVIVMGASAIAGLYALITKLLFKFVGNGSSLKAGFAGLKAPPMPMCACPGVDPEKFVTKELCGETQQTMHAEMETIVQAIEHTHEMLTTVQTNQNENHRAVNKHVNDKFDKLADIIERNNH